MGKGLIAEAMSLNNVQFSPTNQSVRDREDKEESQKVKGLLG